MIFHSAMQNSSTTMKSMYEHSVNRMGGFPMGQKLQQGFAQQKHEMNMKNTEIDM